MCAVAGHWKIERFREPCDLHKGCDAAAIGDIGLGIRHRASRNIVFEFPEGAQIFARCDWYAAGGHDAGMARNIVGNDRLLTPSEVVGLQGARGANGFLDRPFHMASAIRGKPLPRCLRIVCTRVISDARSGRPTFILMARKPLARLSSVCCRSASTERSRSMPPA